MDINEGTTTDDLWTPFKELGSVVEGYLTHEGVSAPYTVHTFESPKNPASREEIKRGITEGVTLPSLGRTLLSKELVDEAIIISEFALRRRIKIKVWLQNNIIKNQNMYNVSEYLALELLHTAQRQMPRHPGLPRGLVAIILALDALRRFTLHTELELLQLNRALPPHRHHARLVANMETTSHLMALPGGFITHLMTRYVDQLISDGVLSSALDALRRFTLHTELELLQLNRALPPHRHHARLVANMETTRWVHHSPYDPLCRPTNIGRSTEQCVGRAPSVHTAHGAGVTVAQPRLAAAQAPRQAGGQYGNYQVGGFITHLMTRYVDQLISDGVLNSALDALRRFTLHTELELLQLNRALPPHRHHARLVANMEITRKHLAGVVFAASAQKGLGRDIILRLLSEMALLYALDLSVLHRREDGEELAKRLPLIQDPDLIAVLVDELSPTHNQTQDNKTTGVRALCQLALGLALAALKRAPQADEAARCAQMYAAEGLRAPITEARTRLDALLRCVQRLYSRDPHRLRDDYWRACETNAHSHRSSGGGGGGGGRAATLFKFVRLSGELVCAALVPAYLRALAALCVPRHTWALLAKRDALSAHLALTALARYYW
ncbi:Uncharacterized protein OBRU01_23708 [Operophtera brumata]|uniref:Uncharacterized protein n=1 Tax=Operophtera brumata TaxID=104452 RepID=A0A0L7KNB6_OPEBR|nr:Uncharacterized protein OBRU01_23708 [Operophtera brumata]